MIQTIKAGQVEEGDTIPGLDNAYVFEEPERNRGYLSYPTPGPGNYNIAMPMDTVVIGYHDAEGNECYLLLPEDTRLTVSHQGPERPEDDD